MNNSLLFSLERRIEMELVERIKSLKQVGYCNAQIAQALGIEPSEVHSLSSEKESPRMKLWLVIFPEPKYSTVDIGISAIIAANTLSDVKAAILKEKKMSVLGDRFPEDLEKSKYQIISHTSVYKRPRVVLVDYRSG
jgi:hypothetical protein